MNFWRKLKIRFLRTDRGVLAYRHRFFLIQHQRRHKLPRICLQYNRISSLHTSHSILHYNSAFLDLDNFFQGHRNWSSVIAPELMSPETITAFFCSVLYFFPLGYFSELMWLSVHCLHIKHQQRWPVTKTGEQTHTIEHVIRILCNVGSPRRHVLHLCGWDLSFVTKSKSAP